MIYKKTFIGISVIFIIACFPNASFAEKSSIIVDSFSVDYEIDNGTVESIVLEPDFFQLVIKMDTFDDGVFEITIPRVLLDAKFENMDDVFFVLIDGFETNYVELKSDSSSRTLIMPFFGGDSTIEIIGTNILTFVPEPIIEIPNWIRNNAGWWADGLISDSDFVSGIQFLIANGIMNIPPTTSSESSTQEIPNWIRNNAGWWADGLISDSDFVSGIQFLIANGIMKV